MADNRYNRWQALAIAQLSVAVALLSGFSVSGLAVGLALLQNDKFLPCGLFKVMFLLAFPLLLFSAITSGGSVVSRLLDFRLTARNVRKTQKLDYEKSLTMFRLGPDAYGRISWFLFWSSCITLLVGATFLFTSICGAWSYRL